MELRGTYKNAAEPFNEPKQRPFVFPKWANKLRQAVFICAVAVPGYVILLSWYGGSPRTTAVGYAPVQPVPYSHALHVGNLGIDCRYCHSTVEDAAFAALPAVQTCMNCHVMIQPDSSKLLPVREAYHSGLPIQWIQVHNLAQYVYFDHSLHVRKGVGCVTCHGRVDRFEIVRQVEPLSMGWCLDCHRHPEPNLRPREFVTKLDWVSPEDPEVLGARLRKEYQVNPSTDCSTCHR
jgi:menaquinone reductase, multiheme cytochrome c subunit